MTTPPSIKNVSHCQFGGPGFQPVQKKIVGSDECQRKFSGKQPKNERETSAKPARNQRQKVSSSSSKSNKTKKIVSAKKFFRRTWQWVSDPLSQG